MAEHNELGRIGEDEAAFFLSMKGYRLLERNWRIGHLEIDIIAENCGQIIVVEVKTRHNTDYGDGFAAVDIQKQKFLIHAAKAYMTIHKLDTSLRFDVITVVGERAPFTISHYKNAFNPMFMYGKTRFLSYEY